jgi:hypothetical protein
MKPSDSVKSALCRAFSNCGTPDSERRVLLASITPELDRLDIELNEMRRINHNLCDQLKSKTVAAMPNEKS